MSEFIYKSAIELAGIIESGKSNSTDIVKAHLEQIRKHNSTLNAIIILLEDEGQALIHEVKVSNLKNILHDLC